MKPVNENMKKCVITKEAVTGKGKPVVTIEENPEKAGTFLQKTGNQESRKNGNRLTGGNR